MHPFLVIGIKHKNVATAPSHGAVAMVVRGALAKTFFPFTFFCGTGAVGGGAKRSASESEDWTPFFYASVPFAEHR